MKSRKVRNRLTAFTLIEVLAAMAVLLILMMALVRIFSETSAASQKANVTVTRNAAARVALAMIRDDIQGSIVDRELAMYSVGNTFAQNFDRIGFITLRQDPDRTNTCLQIQYYVTSAVMTNSSIVYTNWVLMRSSRNVLAPGGKQWWENQSGFDANMLIDNVIRFDVWTCNESGANLNTSTNASGPFGGVNWFDSSLPGSGDHLPDQPPAYIDIYLQVTSDDAMRRGALALAANQNDAAFATFYRESNVLVTRITPLMWAAERIHPLSY